MNRYKSFLIVALTLTFISPILIAPKISAQFSVAGQPTSLCGPLTLALPDFNKPSSSDKYINQADVDAISKATEAIGKFTATTSDLSISEQDIVIAAENADIELRKLGARSFYSADLGRDYELAGKQLAVSSNKLAEVVRQSVVCGSEGAQSLYYADAASEQVYLDKLNLAINDYNKDVDFLNSSVNSANKTIISDRRSSTMPFVALLGISIALSIGLFIWSKRLQPVSGQNDETRVEIISKARRDVAKASLAPVIGIAISVGSYYFADKLGGSYFFAWGIILFGFVYFIRSIVDYLKIKK